MRVGVAVVSVAAAVALSVAARAQEPAAPGPEQLREQIQYRPFTIRIFGPSDLYWQSRIEFTRGKKWSRTPVDEFVEVLKRCATVCDIDGDRQEELVPQTFSGGALLLLLSGVFAREVPALMARFEAHDSGAMLKDADGDGITEFHSEDMPSRISGRLRGSGAHAHRRVVRQRRISSRRTFHAQTRTSEDEWKAAPRCVRTGRIGRSWTATFDDEEWGRVPFAVGRHAGPHLLRQRRAGMDLPRRTLAGRQTGQRRVPKDFEAQLATSRVLRRRVKAERWTQAGEEQP